MLSSLGITIYSEVSRCYRCRRSVTVTIYRAEREFQLRDGIFTVPENYGAVQLTPTRSAGYSQTRAILIKHDYIYTHTALIQLARRAFSGQREITGKKAPAAARKNIIPEKRVEKKNRRKFAHSSRIFCRWRPDDVSPLRARKMKKLKYTGPAAKNNGRSSGVQLTRATFSNDEDPFNRHDGFIYTCTERKRCVVPSID